MRSVAGELGFEPRLTESEFLVAIDLIRLFSQPRRKWAMTYQWVAARFPTADAGSSRHFRLPCGSYD